MRSLVWFRNDLRIDDNPALYHACKHSDGGVIAVFAICPEQWRLHHWGSNKVNFILRNLNSLVDALNKLNIPLKLIHTQLFKSVPRKILKLAIEHHCDAIYLNEEYEVNEKERDRNVAQLFQKENIEVYTYTDQVILNIGELRTGTGRWYSKYTPFRRKWLTVLNEQGIPTIFRKPLKQKPLPVQSDKVPNTLSDFADTRVQSDWPAGESFAKKRLTQFVGKRIESYKNTRDFPYLEGTSSLSPYLAAGVLSPRRCFLSAVDANKGKASGGQMGIDTWITELIWREFYRHVLLGFPRVCRDRPFRVETDRIPWRHDHKLFDAWCDGRTGFPMVDAAMRQLKQIGWMHNRLRMIVAMFLTKDLFIDWRWGETYFMQHLIDGDFASNNGGWQWSASTGTDAAPYFRVFNPYIQSRKFDPEGKFIRQYIPELAQLDSKSIHQPDEAQARMVGYPTPIILRDKTRENVNSAFQNLR